MQVRITRHQAVWECESFWLQAPDGLDEDALGYWADEQLERHDSATFAARGDAFMASLPGFVTEANTLQTVDSVEGFDTQVEVHPA